MSNSFPRFSSKALICWLTKATHRCSNLTETGVVEVISLHAGAECWRIFVVKWSSYCRTSAVCTALEITRKKTDRIYERSLISPPLLKEVWAESGLSGLGNGDFCDGEYWNCVTCDTRRCSTLRLASPEKVQQSNANVGLGAVSRKASQPTAPSSCSSRRKRMSVLGYSL